MLRKRWVAAAALVVAGFAAPTASAETIYGLTDSDDLVTFDSTTPGTTSDPVDITGITANTTLIGIDVRPATLEIFALGSNGQLYSIDAADGGATPIGSPLTLNGTSFDIDFNPTVDRLRVVSDADQNLRVNPNNGALAATDPDLNPSADVTGAAYTNSAPASYAFPNNPATQLFDIDTTSDQLLQQNPANAGTLVMGKALGVDLVGDVGFDISTATGTNGDVGANTAYLVGRTSDTNDRLYTVDLDSGAATAVGEIGSASKVKDLTVAAPTPLLAVLTTPALATSPQQLAYYRADRPGDLTFSVNISGLQTGERLVGIDRNALNGVIYGVGDTSRIYAIDPATGTSAPIGSSAFTPALNGAQFGVDFNPAANRLRVVSNTEQNLRLNQIDGTGTNGTGFNDGTLDYATGDPNDTADPTITAAGYTNSTPSNAVATATTLFDLDTGLDILATQTPANDGTLQSRGALGLDVTGDNGFDIIGRFNQQFAVLTPTNASDGATALYNIAGAGSPANGAVAEIGDIGGLPVGSTIAGMTIVADNILPAAPTPQPEPTPTYTIPTPTPTATYPIPTPTPTVTPTPKRKRPGLKVKVRPKRDKKSPFRFTATGKVIVPKSIGNRLGCRSGQVRLSLRRKGSGKPVSTTRKSIKKNCKFKVRTGFPANRLPKKQRAKGKLKAKVRFQGNATLKPKRIVKQVAYGRK